MGEKDRHKVCKEVAGELVPRHDRGTAMIQLNDTLAQLAGRRDEKKWDEDDAFKVNMRKIMRKQLELVTRGLKPAQVTEDVLKKVFKILDTDGSGCLDNNEVVEALKVLDFRTMDA